MPETIDEQYYRRVEEHFGQRRGGPLVLSPKDWRLIEKWHEKGIPLKVVLRGINHAFDRFEATGPRPDRINSLRYCEQEVHAAWEDHRAAHGRRDSGPREPASSALPGAGSHLSEVAAACRAAAAGQPAAGASCLTRAADSLDALRTEAAEGVFGARELDRRANELEAGLLAELDDLPPTEPPPPAIKLPRFSPYEA